MNSIPAVSFLLYILMTLSIVVELRTRNFCAAVSEAIPLRTTLSIEVQFVIVTGRVEQIFEINDLLLELNSVSYHMSHEVKRHVQ